MIKLYDEDSYIKSFSAVVEKCEKARDGYKILLDRTAFFPTAGGQACDTGTIDACTVSDVIEENGLIYHVMHEQIPVGKKVEGKIDWNVRFRKMQHHTAEHIVSGLVHSIFGFENTGFHLSEHEVTMDIGGILTEEELSDIEKRANEAVWENRAVRAYYPDRAELSEISYRSKLELTENVRIVTIDEIDICACCAPHVKRTGEIGLIKLSGLMRHRGGVRLSLICGPDALADYNEKAQSVYNISKLLSAKQREIFTAVGRVTAELDEFKQRTAAYERKIAEMRAERICETDKCVCIFDNESDGESMRLFANAGKKKCKIFAVFSGDDRKGYSFTAASDRVELRGILKGMNTLLCAKGGGTDDMIRGFAKAARCDIEKFFEEI